MWDGYDTHYYCIVQIITPVTLLWVGYLENYAFTGIIV